MSETKKYLLLSNEDGMNEDDKREIEWVIKMCESRLPDYRVRKCRQLAQDRAAYYDMLSDEMVAFTTALHQGGHKSGRLTK